MKTMYSHSSPAPSLKTLGNLWPCIALLAHLGKDSQVLPNVVISAKDHAALGVTGRADVAQLRLAAGALEAPAVPVAVHGIEQKAVRDLAPAACAPLPGEGAGRHRGRLCAAARIHHGLQRAGRGKGEKDKTWAMQKLVSAARTSKLFLLQTRWKEAAGQGREGG